MQAVDIPLPASLAHAYVIAGGSGESRRAWAQRLTAAWLCRGEDKPCGHCPACVKVARGIHPDVIFVSPGEDKKEITVADARKARSDVYIRPNEGSRKVYLIDPADAMRDAAQNVLLKVLEDGPDYAAFALLTAQPGRLLETVRSRCELITLPPEEMPQPDPELARRGRELCGLLLHGSEWEAAQDLVALEGEKLGQERLMAVLAAAEETAAKELGRDRRAVSVLRALKTCRENGIFNPGAGHMLGWLCAELFR